MIQLITLVEENMRLNLINGAVNKYIELKERYAHSLPLVELECSLLHDVSVEKYLALLGDMRLSKESFNTYLSDLFMLYMILESTCLDLEPEAC